MAVGIDFETLFSRSPNPYMVLAPDFTFVAANDEYLKVTSSRREDLIGRGLFEMFPGDPEDPNNVSARQLRDSLERVLSSRQPDTIALIRYPISRPSGNGFAYEERYWSATHIPLLDEKGDVELILQHTVDVTELQQLKRALRQAESVPDQLPAAGHLEEGVFRRALAVQEANFVLAAERSRLRNLFEQAPGFMAIMRGPTHIVELANAAYYQLVGHREIVGKSVRDAIPEVEGQGFFELLDQVYESGETFVGREVSVRLQRQPGSPLDEVFVDFVYQPVFEPDGSVGGIFSQGHEVTAQKQAREELRRLNQTLEARIQDRTAELEARNRELQEFAHVASHDLQEPLRKVHFFADLLAEEYGEAVGDEGRWYVERLQNATERMTTLIQDLLAYSRVSTLHHDFDQVDLRGVVEGVLGDLQVLIQETGGEIEIGEFPQVEADPVQMRQLFQNLIGNALKFRRSDVTPVVRVGGVVEKVGDDSFCHLKVEDNGIGFDAVYAERIFLPFQRLHGRSEYSGTGIGLAICRRIVERHRGTIRAESEPGIRSTFHVWLPVNAQ